VVTLGGANIPCPRCGGIFAVASIGGPIACIFCAHRFELSAERLAELARYQSAVKRALAQADVHQRQATAVTQWAARSTDPKDWIVPLLLLVLFVPPMVLAPVLASGNQTGVVMVLIIGLSVVYLALLVGYAAWRSSTRSQARSANAATKRVACPSCGAPNDLHVGQTHETCRYCGAALLPSRTAMIRVADHAHELERLAEIRRFRAERVQRLQPGAGALPYLGHAQIALAVFLPLTLLTPLIAMLQGRLALALASWPVALLNVSAFVFALGWRHRRIQQWKAIGGDLAHQLGGRRAESGNAEVIRWLNAYWGAPYEHRFLGRGPYHLAVIAEVCAYPALLHVDVVSDTKYFRPHCHLVIAAGVPEQVLRTGAGANNSARVCLDWLSAAGFHVTMRGTGLLASAGPSTLQRFKRYPELCHVLATVVTTLAGLAHALDAPPLNPLPD
jgi:hypothetical protein